MTRAVLGASLLLAALAGSARGELKDCLSPDAQRTGGYTMFLDDILRNDATSTAASGQSSLSALINQVSAAVHSTLGNGQAVAVAWKTCTGRAPKLGEFVPRVRRDLFQNGVVLEIFGDSDGRRLALRHAIIPAMYEQNAEILQIDTVPLAGEPGEDAGAAIDRYRAHLQGYMEVSLALRLLLAVGQSADQEPLRRTAQRLMCEGLGLVFGGGGGRAPAKLAADQSALLDTLLQHMTDAAASPAYDQVRSLLHHGGAGKPVDIGSLLKGACLGPNS